jgi:hypothetical protein
MNEIYFAYSIPYSYSYMLATINELVDKSSGSGILSVSYNMQSSAGLTIPLLTITNPEDSIP